jgi:hypothetical protein
VFDNAGRIGWWFLKDAGRRWQRFTKITSVCPRAPSVTDSIATYLTHDHSKNMRVIPLMYTLPASIEFARDRSEQRSASHE